jgi:hypothetical protein
MTAKSERMIAWYTHVEVCKADKTRPLTWESFKRLIKRDTEEALIEAVCQAHLIVQKKKGN